MSYQKYHQILKLFLIIIAIIIGYKVLNFYSIILSFKSSFLSHILFFAFPISSLFFLFFSVYSLHQRIIIPRKIESPSLFIFLSIILLIISTALPVSTYSDLMRARNDQGTVKAIKALADDVCLNRAFSPDKRQNAARHFYRITGKRIEYLNDNGKKTTFVPLKADEDMYLKYKNIMDDFDRSLANVKIKLYILMILLFSSSIIFVFLMRNTKRKAKLL